MKLFRANIIAITTIIWTTAYFIYKILEKNAIGDIDGAGALVFPACGLMLILCSYFFTTKQKKVGIFTLIGTITSAILINIFFLFSAKGSEKNRIGIFLTIFIAGMILSIFSISLSKKKGKTDRREESPSLYTNLQRLTYFLLTALFIILSLFGYRFFMIKRISDRKTEYYTNLREGVTEASEILKVKLDEFNSLQDSIEFEIYNLVSGSSRQPIEKWTDSLSHLVKNLENKAYFYITPSPGGIEPFNVPWLYTTDPWNDKNQEHGIVYFKNNEHFTLMTITTMKGSFHDLESYRKQFQFENSSIESIWIDSLYLGSRKEIINPNTNHTWYIDTYIDMSFFYEVVDEYLYSNDNLFNDLNSGVFGLKKGGNRLVNLRKNSSYLTLENIHLKDLTGSGILPNNYLFYQDDSKFEFYTVSGIEFEVDRKDSQKYWLLLEQDKFNSIYHAKRELYTLFLPFTIILILLTGLWVILLSFIIPRKRSSPQINCF